MTIVTQTPAPEIPCGGDAYVADAVAIKLGIDSRRCVFCKRLTTYGGGCPGLLAPEFALKPNPPSNNDPSER